MAQDRVRPSSPMRPRDLNFRVSQPEYRPQRVPVSKSMFYAYAAMRGNVDKDIYRSDPLNHNLYLNPISFLDPRFELPVDLPQLQRTHDPHMVRELNGSLVFFYDTSHPMYTDSIPLQFPVQCDGGGAKNIDYEEHKRRSLLQNQPNHYSGEEGYGNYGYISINGYWVDPESEGEIFNALKGRPSASHLPRFSTEIGPLPDMAHDEMYAEFMEEVNFGVDGDNEGDPRGNRITSAIFARWAVGTSRGDSYVTAREDPKESHLSQLRSCKRLPKPMIRHHPQFDHETGSVFSGDYSPETSPSLALTARGVEMANQPTNFARSYPQGYIDLDRAAYGDPDATKRIQDWLASSTDSSPIIYFHEENIIKELATSQDPDSGVVKWNDLTEDIENLQEEYRDELLESTNKLSRRNSLAEEHGRLYKEAYFMEERLLKRDSKMGSVTPTRRRSISRTIHRPTPTKEPFPLQFRHNRCPSTPTRRPPRSNARRAAPSNYGRAHSKLPIQGTAHNQARTQSQPSRTRGCLQTHSTNAFAEPLQEDSQIQYTPNDIPEDITQSHQTRAYSQPLRGRFCPRTEPCFSRDLSPEDDTHPAFTSIKLKRKLHFERYFIEQQERELININKTKAANEQLNAELKDIVEAVEELKVVHEEYCTSLGIQSVSEIPNLIPMRKHSSNGSSDGEMDSNEEDEDEFL